MTYPLNRWYVAGFDWEIGDAPLGRTFLDRPVVLFRDAAGKVAALDREVAHVERDDHRHAEVP